MQLLTEDTNLLEACSAYPSVLREANWWLLDWQHWKIKIFVDAKKQAWLLKKQHKLPHSPVSLTWVSMTHD